MLRNSFQDFGVSNKAIKRTAWGVGIFGLLVILFNLALGGLVLVGLYLGVKWLWLHS